MYAMTQITRLVTSNGFSGFKGFNRFYSSIQSFHMRPSMETKTVEAAIANAKYKINLLVKAGAFRQEQGILKIVCGAEGDLNGRTGSYEWENPDRLYFDANSPIPVEFYQAYANEFINFAKTQSSGSIICTGSTYITYQDSVGKQYGRNLGLLIETGPEGKVLKFGKKNTALNDGWNNNITIETEGKEENIALKTLVGDREFVTTVAVCLDRELMKETGPLIIISPSAGAPEITKGLAVVINDANSSPFHDEGDVFKTGSWVLRSEKPLRIAESPDPTVGNAFGGLFNFLRPIYEIFAPIFSLSGAQKLDPYLRAAHQLFDGEGNVTTDPRMADLMVAKTGDLPDYIAPELLARMAQNNAPGANFVTAPLSIDEANQGCVEFRGLQQEIGVDAIMRGVESKVAAEVQRQIEDNAIDLSAPQTNIYNALDFDVLLADAEDAAVRMFSTWGSEQAEKLNKLFGADRYDRLCQTAGGLINQGLQVDVGGSSCLTAMINSAISLRREHFLQGRLESLQVDINGITAELTTAEQQLHDTQRDSQQVERELEADPDNVELRERKKKLDEEIRQQEEALREQTSRSEEYQREQDKATDNKKEAEREAQSAKDFIAEHRPTHFAI